MDGKKKRNPSQSLQEPIAVVGLACLFPGSLDIEKYWDNILNKRDLFTDVPKTHWLLDDFYDPDPFNLDKTYCRRAATLPEVPFDYMAFGIPPNVLPQTDSTQLLSLVIAKALMEDAFGGQWKDVDREKASVIFGFSQGTVLSGEWGANVITPIFIRAMQECGIGGEQIHKILKQSKKYRHQADENTFPGALGNVIAGRIANRFDFHGTNCVVDAACASSLSALHLGIKELNTGESDLVITGGVQTISSPGTFICFTRTPALSMKGICRPFDDESDGIMLGEGLGFLALKRLSDAERDKNQIYAVIRGIGSSSDGKGKSIYAPEPTGQVRALERSYQNAGYGPETVELIEAHGTGTRAGDIAELTSLHQYFAKKETSDSKYCALGSVKSQIGHTLGAAGAASLIKTILALHHKILPPTINVIKPSRILDSKNSPFYLNLESRPWIHSQDYPRRASVSSFGFGGTNFHVALEEYRGPGQLPPRRDIFPAELLVYSGHSPSDLIQQFQSTISEYESGRSLYALAKDTQGKFSPTAPHRLSLVVNSGEDLKKKLTQIEQGLEKNPERLWLPPLGIYYYPKFKPNKVAFLFPGQGSQYVNMGADLAMHFDAFRETWDRADRLDFENGTRLSRVAFPPPAFSDEERTAHQKRLTATEWAQPCLGVTSAAMLSLMEEMNLKADMVAGHSFGEETALYFAGCYDLETFLKISRKRGELMAHASEIPGGMMAVSGEASKIQSILAELGTDIVIANFNSPDQSVISGRKEALSSIRLRLEQEGMKVTPLQVSTAFHSSLVSGSSEKFYNFLKEVDIKSPKIPVYSNSNASVYPSDPEKIRKNMAEQLALPVRFLEEIHAMYEAGANVFLEVGPGATLTGLTGNILNEKEYLTVNTDIQKKDGILSLINAVAQLTAVGIPVDFKALGKRELAERHIIEKTSTMVMVGSATYKKKYPIADEDPTKQALSRAPVVAGSSKETHAGVPQKLLDLIQKAKGADQASIPETAIRAAAIGSDLVPPLENKIPPVAAQPYALKQMPSAPKIEKRIPKINNPQPMTQAGLKQESTFQAIPAEASAPTPVNPADLEKLKTLLLQIISEKTGYPQEIIDPNMNLEADLGIDSIKRVEIFMTLKERVPELPEVGLESLAGLQTIGMIVNFMKEQSGMLTGSENKMPTDAEIKHLPSMQNKFTSDLSVEDTSTVSVPGTASSPSPSPQNVSVSSDDLAKLKDLLLQVIAEKTGYPQEILAPEMNLEADLGIDSIKRVEIFMTLKERAPELPEVGLETLAGLQTIGMIINFMKEHAGMLIGSENKIPTGAKIKYPASIQEKFTHDIPMKDNSKVNVAGVNKNQVTEQNFSGNKETLQADFPQIKTIPVKPRTASPSPSPQHLSVSSGDLAKLKDLLLQVIAEKTGYPQEILAPEMNLEADLGIDSIKRVEIFMTLKERAPELPEVGLEILAELQTIGQIIDFMHQGAQNLGKTTPPQEEPHLDSNLEVPIKEQPAASVKIPMKEKEKEKLGLSEALTLQAEENISENLSRFELKVVPLTSQSAVQLAPGKELIIVSEGLGIAEALSKLFERGGIRNRIIKDEEEIGEVAACGGLIYLGGLRPLQHFYSGVKMNKEAFRLANKLAVPIQEAINQGGAWFITVQDLGGEFGLNHGDLIASLRGGLAGLTKTVAREWSGVYAKAIDIAISGRSPEELAQDIYQEILKGGVVIEVGLPRAGERIGLQIVGKEPVSGKVSPINEKSVIVVSGGARGVTSSCVTELAKKFHPKIVLFGRSPVIEEPNYCQGIAGEAGLKKAILEEAKRAGNKVTPRDISDQCRGIMNSREIRHTISELQRAGSPVKYYAVDILESRLIRSEGPSWIWQAGSLVRAALAEVRQEWGPITGLIHGAGVIQDKLIQEKTQEQFNLVFDTKVSGLHELLNALEKDPLSLIVLFSSISARIANRGQSDYAMANEVLNKIAQAEKRRRGGSCQVKAIGWGPWDGGMLSPFLREQFTKSGVSLISLNGGANAMIREIEDVSGAVEVLIQGSQYQSEIWWKGQLYSKSPSAEFPAIQREKSSEGSLIGKYEISKNAQGNLHLTASRFFDPAKDTWLQDHCPTWTFPVLPFTVMTAMMKQAGERLYPDLKVVQLNDVKVSSWVSFLEGPQEVRIQAESLSEEGTTKSIKVTLLQYRKAPTTELSRFLPFCTGKVLMSPNFAQTQQGPEFLAEDSQKILSREEIYGEGYRFHGPVFQLLEKMIFHPQNKVTAYIQNCRQKYPDQNLAYSLILDNVGQAVPGWESLQWTLQNEGTVGFPYLMKKVIFYKALPEKSRLRCEVGFLSFGVDKRLPEWKLRVFDGDGEKDDIWMEAEYVEVLVPLGKRSLGFFPWVTRNFAQDRKILPDNNFSNLSDITYSTISISELKTQDWLPGTLASNYLSKEEMADYLKLSPDKRYLWLAPRIAAKEMVAKMENIHPAQVIIQENGEGKLVGISEKRPLNPYQFKYDFNGRTFRVQKITNDIKDSPLFKTHLVKTDASNVSLGENLAKALAAKFAKELVIEDYQEFINLGGKPCLFLANHQTFIESFLFIIGVTFVGETKTVVVAKKEHQEGWIGKLAGLYTKIPELESMQNMLFIQRERPEELFVVLSQLKQKLLEENKSLLVHVEGTRAKKADEPVKKLSTILTDLSIQTGIPIVPLRFRGGLPLQENGRKYDFPVGYGKQSSYIGKAIFPDSLKTLDLRVRSQRVLEAINALGGAENEFPEAPDQEFEKNVEAWRKYTGVEEAPAVLYQSLVDYNEFPFVEIKSGVQEFSDLIQAFIIAGQWGQKSGQPTALVLPDSLEGKFAAELGAWVFGYKGPRIFVGTEADEGFKNIVKVAPSPTTHS